MDIGDPIRTIIVEPAEDPFRREEPSEPTKLPAPTPETDPVPEKVPA